MITCNYGQNYTVNTKKASKPSFKSLSQQEIRMLDSMVEKSEKVMQETMGLFESRTLKELYTPKYHYTGCFSNIALIKNKADDKPARLNIAAKIRKDGPNRQTEYYTATNNNSRKLGVKSFSLIDLDKKPAIETGAMKSYRNEKYAGTQIRLTQVEVERAMQNDIDNIPLIATSQSLPFHAMMGFKPDEMFKRIESMHDVNSEMRDLKKRFTDVAPKNFVPVIHKVDDQYFFDYNQTIAGIVLRHLNERHAQYYADERVFPLAGVNMHLDGKELEAWKQRALSQPILLTKNDLKKYS
jgi:hypothetical protein